MHGLILCIVVSFRAFFLLLHAVGLDSGLQAADVKRKPLNLVILLDYSGSMSSSFDRYYYDQFGERKELTQDGEKVFLRHYSRCEPMNI